MVRYFILTMRRELRFRKESVFASIESIESIELRLIDQVLYNKE